MHAHMYSHKSLLSTNMLLYRFSGWLIGRFDITFADIAMVCVLYVDTVCVEDMYMASIKYNIKF